MVLINGQEADCLPVGDRGLLYGDGIFSTAGISRGRLELWPRHRARLASACERLGIALPDPLDAEAEALAAGVERGVLRLTLTRGAGVRGYAPPPDAHPTRILALYPWPAHPEELAEQGVAIRVCETRLAIQPALAGLKTLNRLEQVLARSEWSDPGIREGLMLDTEGRVVEGTFTNLFWCRGGQLFTPALARCGIAGVMRAEILALAGEFDLSVAVGDFELDAVFAADEVFLCNSLIRIWPVSRLANRTWPVGPWTRRLQQALRLRLNPSA